MQPPYRAVSDLDTNPAGLFISRGPETPQPTSRRASRTLAASPRRRLNLRAAATRRRRCSAPPRRHSPPPPGAAAPPRQIPPLR